MNDGLATVLEKCAAASKEVDELSSQLRESKRRLEELENLATEMIGASGLSRVSVAGRTWWAEESLLLSIPKEVRDEAFDAAEAEGILDELLTLNTSTLKSWLVERAKEQGQSLRDAAQGTAFESVVKGCCRVRLRSRAS